MPPVGDSGEPLLCDLDAADAQQRRDMTCVKYSAALAAVACATYLGILLGQQHRNPSSIHGHGGHDAPHHGPPRPPRPSRRSAGDDDLDAAAAERHHIHAEPHSPELIQWGDWSAKGRFTKPPARPYSSDYPQLTNLWEIVQRWNPDNVSIPVPFRETLAVLNYSDPHERSLAEAYRNAEVPFKIYDVPDVEYARDAWTDVYLTEQFGPVWKSNFGRPTPSTRRSCRDRVGSMAFRQTKVSASDNLTH